MDRCPSAAELDRRLRVLFGVLPPGPDAAPTGSPYAAGEDIEPFDVRSPAGAAEPADAEAALAAWLATPNPSFGGLCPRSLIDGTDDQRAFLAAFVSSIEDGAFS